MHTLEDVRGYATGLRAILRELGVNSGDMEKGVIRFEANVSIRPAGSTEFGTRVEIKNLNSFRAMERAVAYELERQAALLDKGEQVAQETLGWNETAQETYSQRSKEEAHDYRYFPEPDLPPLIVEKQWVEAIRSSQPELPRAKAQRLQREYGLNAAEAQILAAECEIAEYFETCASSLKQNTPRTAAVWITGELFAWMNQSGSRINEVRVSPQMFAGLLDLLHKGSINQNTAKSVLVRMLETGKPASEIIEQEGLSQLSDKSFISELVTKVINSHPKELESYLAGKETLSNWFFGQAMKAAGGKANPAVLKDELEKQLQQTRDSTLNH
jgi:aspartyl-tRNA(Asn)/glutamyl-tRNA(Gln) amidotransferase subunit B